ncbi:MAG: 3'-5' exonuclease [bacterium]
MIVVDVETTGVDPDRHSIVSIGAVDFLHPERRFYEECRIWDGAIISDEALAINGYTREEVTDIKKQSLEEILKKFFMWVEESEGHTIMVLHPIFDLSFLDESAERYHLQLPFPKRSLDLHSICFAHMIKGGLIPPIINKHSAVNSDLIMQYVGIPTEPKPHIALNGALYEAEAFSRLLYDKNLLPEFAEYPLPWLKR